LQANPHRRFFRQRNFTFQRVDLRAGRPIAQNGLANAIRLLGPKITHVCANEQNIDTIRFIVMVFTLRLALERPRHVHTRCCQFEGRCATDRVPARWTLDKHVAQRRQELSETLRHRNRAHRLDCRSPVCSAGTLGSWHCWLRDSPDGRPDQTGRPALCFYPCECRLHANDRIQADRSLHGRQQLFGTIERKCRIAICLASPSSRRGFAGRS
jgi:hypothetical protein